MIVKTDQQAMINRESSHAPDDRTEAPADAHGMGTRAGVSFPRVLLEAAGFVALLSLFWLWVIVISELIGVTT